MMPFTIWTGLQTSELVALDWDDMDWVRRKVMIRRAMTQASGRKAEVTKIAAGLCSVKFLLPDVEALKMQKAHTLRRTGRFAEP
jgi:integrase